MNELTIGTEGALYKATWKEVPEKRRLGETEEVVVITKTEAFEGGLTQGDELGEQWTGRRLEIHPNSIYLFNLGRKLVKSIHRVTFIHQVS
jgi:hypothetical protein